MKKQINYIIQTICIILMTLILIKGITPAKYDISIGDTCPVDIYAPRSVVDKITTDKQRERAGENVTPQYELDNDITLKADRNLANIFIEIAKERSGEASSFKSEYCARLPEDEFQEFRTAVTEAQQNIMNNGITEKEEALNEAKSLIMDKLKSDAAAAAGVEILNNTLEVNKFPSETKTVEEIERAKSNVPSVTYKENQIIVRRGDIVTEAQYFVLSELGLISGDESMRIWQIIGVALFMIMCFVIAAVYIRINGNKKLFTPKINTMVCIAALLSLCISLLSTVGTVNKYILPVAAGAAILAILAEVKFSLLMNVLITSAAAIATGGDMYYFFSVFVSGCICIYLFSNIAQRRKLVFSSLLFSVLTGAAYFAIGLIQSVEIKESLMRALFGAVSALITSVIVMGTLPFWENVFDIITPFRLSDLANPNQPLLKRLLLEAPGTYHHSLMVGNLAEAACEQIGGNYLLARTGAYYHDIGKLLRPEMFTENQYGINPHDTLEPKESAQIIIKHISDGKALAQEYKLPDAIKRIIFSHHGKTAVVYFLNKAQRLGETVNEDDFRYPGDLPATREEAVVMLADSCEAAVRSLDEKNEVSIKAMIEKIIASKIADSQLRESPITFEELETIQNTFIKVFSGYFHSRIKYPDSVPGKDDAK